MRLQLYTYRVYCVSNIPETYNLPILKRNLCKGVVTSQFKGHNNVTLSTHLLLMRNRYQNRAAESGR